MASADAKQPGFTVKDRRSFQDASGDSENAPGAPAVAQPAPGRAAVDAGSSPGPGAEAESPGAGRLPAVDFHTFVLSLGSSALLHLGELEHPDAGGPQKDLGLAKHTIDILVMLEQKTKGNLTAAEAKLIESLLYDLRLRYVEATKAS
jgi:uncharacterized protein DUF1844